MSHQTKKHLGVTLHSRGAEFRVWAPFAKQVTLLLPFLDVFDGSNQHKMTAEGDGYWSVNVKSAEPGQNYRFMIDTGKETVLRNDPRGRVVTASENGVSVIAPADFEWETDTFEPAARNKQIIYELHIGTFSRRDSATQGTFYDAIEKLDYLKNLGVNTIELMPVTSMAYSNGWGYNVNEFFSIESAYGGRHGLMEFVKQCHKRGLGVIIDVVYNHYMSGDLWRFDGWYENDRGGIYFYNDERGDTPWGARPDYGRPEVRQFLLDNVVMWFQEFHVDGLRLDSTGYMRNTQGHSNDPAHDIGDAWSLLGEITTLAHKLRPNAVLIAEDTSDNEYITKALSDGGCGFDAQWGLGFPHAVRQTLGITPPYPVDLLHELGASYNGDCFQRVIFADSHDTAANGNERLAEAVTPYHATSLAARQRLLLAAAVTLTAPGVPMLLQGQEFMQEGAFNDWQELQWSNIEKYPGIIKAHHDLIALRLNTNAQTAGLLGQSVAVFHNDSHNNVIGYHRWDKGGAGDDVIVLANFNGTKLADYSITLPRTGRWVVRFNSSWKGYGEDFPEHNLEEITTDDHGTATCDLAPYSTYIFSQD